MKTIEFFVLNSPNFHCWVSRSTGNKKFVIGRFGLKTGNGRHTVFVSDEWNEFFVLKKWRRKSFSSICSSLTNIFVFSFPNADRFVDRCAKKTCRIDVRFYSNEISSTRINKKVKIPRDVRRWFCRIHFTALTRPWWDEKVFRTENGATWKKEKTDDVVLSSFEIHREFLFYVRTKSNAVRHTENQTWTILPIEWLWTTITCCTDVIEIDMDFGRGFWSHS